MRRYEIAQEYISATVGMFVHPLASPKAVKPVGEVVLYAVSRDLLMDFVQDPKQHWSFSKPTECTPHVALLLVGTRNLLNGCVDHFMGMVYVSGVQGRLRLADAVQTLLTCVKPVPPDGESEVPAVAVLVGVKHFPPWLCPADPPNIFCTFGGDPSVAYGPLAELQGGLLRIVGILTNSDVWPCCVVIPETLNGGVIGIVSHTPPGRFSNAPVGCQRFRLPPDELPVTRKTMTSPEQLLRLGLGFPLVPPFEDGDQEALHVAVPPYKRMAFSVIPNEQPVYDGSEATGFQLASVVVSEEYETHLAPIVLGARQGVQDRLCEFLRQCSDQRSQQLAVVQERHADTSQGVVDLLNKLLISLRSKQEPSKPFTLTPAEAGPAQVSRTTPAPKVEGRDRHREPPSFSASKASKKVHSLVGSTVEEGFAQRRNLDQEVARDAIAAETLDAAMQMERLRASHEANQAKSKELGLLEDAVVAFRKGVGRRLGALDLCPTAGPSGVLSGYLRGLTRQAISQARDTITELWEDELRQYQCWELSANKDCSRLLSILTELLRSDTRLLKVMMCISIGNDLVLQCAQARAGTSHSGAGDARDLAQQIESALDQRVVTGDLQAVATRVLTEAFASDSDNPHIEQLRSAVATGCKEAAALEAAMHLERNARSALQNIPASKWKEVLERAFRAYPALLERPVKNTVAEVSPDVILALLRGGTEKVGTEGLLELALKEDAGKRVLSSLVAPLVLAHLPEKTQVHLEGAVGRAQVESVVRRVTHQTLIDGSANVEALKATLQGDISTIHDTLVDTVTKELPSLIPAEVVKQTALDAARKESADSVKLVDDRLTQEVAALRRELQSLRENRGLMTPLMSPPRPGINISSFSSATPARPSFPPAGSQVSGGQLVAPPSMPSITLGYARGYSVTKRLKCLSTQAVPDACGSSAAVAASLPQSQPVATQASPYAAREAEAGMEITDDKDAAVTPQEVGLPDSSSTPQKLPDAVDKPWPADDPLTLRMSLGGIAGPPSGYRSGRSSRVPTRDRKGSSGGPSAPRQRSQRSGVRRFHPSLAGMEGNDDSEQDDAFSRDDEDEDEDGDSSGALDRSGSSRRGSPYHRSWRQHLDRIRDEGGADHARFLAERAHLQEEKIQLSAGRKPSISVSTYLDAWAYSRALDDELVSAARSGWRQLGTRQREEIAAWFPNLESGPALHWLTSGWWNKERQKEHPIIPVDCVDEESYSRSPLCEALVLPALSEYEGASLQRLRNTMIAAAWAREQRRTDGDRPREYLFVTLVYDRDMTGASAGLEPFHGASTTRAFNGMYFCAWCEGASGSTTNADTYNAHMRVHLGLAPVCGQCFGFTMARQQDKFSDHFAKQCPQRHQFGS